MVTVALAITAQNTSSTLASWADSEWVSSAPQALGTVNCATPQNAFASRGEGRVLSGSLLGLDSVNVADITGVRTTNDGELSRRQPMTAAVVSGMDDAYADPLRLGLLNDQIAIDLTSVLQLPLDTDLGLLGQFGQAESTGGSAGVGGYVDNTGNINFSGAMAGYPSLATLKLSTLLNSLGVNLGTLVGDTALDVELGIGAVAGRAALVDPCQELWGSNVATAVPRDYLAAGLTTGITSPVVKVLGTTVDSTLLNLQNTANGLVGQTGLLSGVTTAALGLVTTLINTLGLITGVTVANGAQATLVGLDLDLSAVRTLVDNPAQDPNGVLSISLRSGRVTVDTAALLEAAYPGVYSNGLNGLPPNTNLLTKPLVLETLKARLTGVLQNLVADVDRTLNEALDNATVTAVLTIPLQQCRVPITCGTRDPRGAVSVQVTGTLADLLAGAIAPTVDTSGVSPLISGLVDGLVNLLLGNLTATLGSSVGAAVNNLLRPIVTGLLPTLNTLTTPVVNLVSDVYMQLYLNGLVAVTFNAQNNPLLGDPEPHDWEALQDGRYDVAAIRIGLLDVLNPSAVWLYLGRGSVGSTCSVMMAPINCAGY